MSANVTMHDVARKAGVHQTTVSLALRNHPRIPAATRARIHRIARELGYRTNPLVAALVASRGRRRKGPQASLGYVSADPPHQGGAAAISGYADLLEGVRARAEVLGYGVDHLWLGDPGLTPGRFTQIAETRGIHGLIIAPLAEQRRTLGLPWDRFASVAYGYSLVEPAIHRVTPDFYHGMLDALQHLRRSGRHRVGLVINDNVDRKSDHFWLAAYLADQRLGRPQDAVAPFFYSTWDDASFTRWAARERPSAILALDSTLDQIAPLPAARGIALTSLYTNGKYPGIFGDRRRAGAICVEVVVAQLHRNERGVPTHAQNVLVRSDWHARKDPPASRALIRPNPRSRVPRSLRSFKKS